MNKSQYQLVTSQLSAGNFQGAKLTTLESLKNDKNDALAWKILGFIETKLGQHDEALKAKREALRISPKDPECHSNLANSLREKGDLELAERHYREALKLNPRFAPAINRLAGLFSESGRLQEATLLLESALLLDSKSIDIALHLSTIYLREKRFSEVQKVVSESLKHYPDEINLLTKLIVAEINLGNLATANKLCVEVLETLPNHEPTLVNLAVIRAKERDFHGAIEIFNKVITLNANSNEAHRNLAVLHKDIGNRSLALNHALIACRTSTPDERLLHTIVDLCVNYEDANNESAKQTCLKYLEGEGASFDSARGYLAHRLKDYWEAEFFYKRATESGFSSEILMGNYGALLIDSHRYLEAVRLLQNAVEVFPKYAPIISNLALANSKLGNTQIAESLYIRAIELDKFYAGAMLNYSVLMHSLGRYDDAIQQLRKILSIDPNHPEALKGLSQALIESGQPNKALEVDKQLLAAHPTDIIAKWNHALNLLRTGDFKNGFEAYEIRWQWKEFPSPKRELSKRKWNGRESLKDKCILIHYEQGLGDTIQFSRYLSLLSDRGAYVLFYSQKPLVPLLKTLRGNIEFIEELHNGLEFDFHAPLLSCPLLLHTDSGSIPNSIPYLKSASELKAKFRVEHRPGMLNVGFAYSGSHAHGNDRARSINIDLFKTLFALENCNFHCIQKDIKHEDVPTLLNCKNVRIHSDDLIDFADTAALIDQMDLIVTVDTSVAHVAGALGKKTYLLLGFGTDWRWGLSGDKSDWYPTFKLFRRINYENESDLFSHLINEIGSNHEVSGRTVYPTL